MDWWNGFCEWCGTIDWGDAPTWFATILASVSVFLALLILFTDKRRARRAEFMKVVPRHMVESKDGDTTLRVVVYNANEHPIPMVVLHVWSGLIWTRRVLRGEKYPFAISPQEEGRVGVPLTEDLQDHNYYLEVVDSLGESWYRGVRSLKPISKRRVKRWNKRNDCEEVKRLGETGGAGE